MLHGAAWLAIKTEHGPVNELLGRSRCFTKTPTRMKAHHVQNCIDACLRCAVACDRCQDACLNEPEVNMMVACIRLDRDCSKICYLAASFLASNSPFAGQACALCAQVCDACADECENHAAHMDHCRECAEACRQCAEECRKMVASQQA